MPKGNIRPLSDQVKEALFNILRNKVEGSSFLDLFAGTGSVGIEALSRGALLSIFVELDRRTVDIIRENLKDCGFEEQAEVYALDALRAVKILKRKEGRFDIIFIGAPYGSPNLVKVFKELSDGSLLKENGVVVAEHRKQHKIESEIGQLKQVREACYGETVLSFYKI